MYCALPGFAGESAVRYPVSCPPKVLRMTLRTRLWMLAGVSVCPVEAGGELGTGAAGAEGAEDGVRVGAGRGS